MLDAVIYARTSSEEEEKLSVDEQILECRQLAENQYNIKGVYFDKDTSGRTYPTGHPLAYQDHAYKAYCQEHIPRKKKRYRNGLAQALKALPKGGILLVREETRLVRQVLNSYLQTAITQDLRAKNVVLHTVKSGIMDLTSHQTQMISTIQSMSNDQQILSQVQASKRSLATKRDTGYLTSGVKCLGYRSAGVQKVERIENEITAVQAMFDLALDGKGYSAIARALNTAGYTTKQGKSYTHGQIKKTITRPCYAELQRNSLGELIDSVPYNGLGCVSKSDYLTVQQLIKKRSKARSTQKHFHPFAGLLVCGHCGKRLQSFVAKPFRTADEKKVDHRERENVFYYRCPSGILVKNSPCRKSIIRESIVEKSYGGLIECLTPWTYQGMVNAAKRLQMKPELIAKKEELSAQIEVLTEKETSSTDKWLDQKLSEKQYEKVMETIAKKIDAININIQKINAELAKNATSLDITPVALVAIIYGLDVQHLADYLREAIDRVIIHAESIEIITIDGAKVIIDRIHDRSSRSLPLPSINATEDQIAIHYRYKSKVEAIAGKKGSDVKERVIFANENMKVVTVGKNEYTRKSKAAQRKK